MAYIETLESIKIKLMYEWKNVYRMLNSRTMLGSDTVTKK